MKPKIVTYNVKRVKLQSSFMVFLKQTMRIISVTIIIIFNSKFYFFPDFFIFYKVQVLINFMISFRKKQKIKNKYHDLCRRNTRSLIKAL